MVDFNADNTMTRPRKDVVNFMILQQLQDLLDIYCKWEIEQEKGTGKLTIELKSQILKMIMLIRTPLETKLTKEKQPTYTNINNMREILITANSTEIITMVEYIERFLYEKDVTKWDSKEFVDRTKVWDMNQKFLG
jgi:hypothetical protein